MNRFLKIFFALCVSLIIIATVIACDDNKNEFESTSYMIPTTTERTTNEFSSFEIGVDTDDRFGPLITFPKK